MKDDKILMKVFSGRPGERYKTGMPRKEPG
jgi:hypothetical protein